MRRKRYKNKKYFTILLIVVSVMIVGYAFLSSTLNMFGGLSIIGGNNWGVKWNNIQVNSDSNAEVISAPQLQNNDTSILFQVTLNQPGDFYEFTVDAVNTGTIDAMIDSVNYAIYDQDNNEVYPEFIEYQVTYSNGVNLAANHLLLAGETATYKVRLKYSTNIDPDDLPNGEEAFRFEFGVTYIQADSSAIDPNSFTIYANNLIDVYDAKIGDDISNFDTYYTDYYEAMDASGNNIFLSYYIVNNKIEDMYVGFLYDDEVYILDSTPGADTYNENMDLLKEIFGEDNCGNNHCIVNGLDVYANVTGGTYAVNSNKWRCGVSSDKLGARCRYIN